MGAAIARGIADDLWERVDLVISTKIFFGGRGQRDTLNSAQNISRKKLYEGLRASLERLNLEYVDVVFCHRPDPTTPIEETVRASLSTPLALALCLTFIASSLSGARHESPDRQRDGVLLGHE